MHACHDLGHTYINYDWTRDDDENAQQKVNNVERKWKKF